MRVFYVAHPYGAKTHNIARAKRWYLWLINEYLPVTFDEPIALLSQWMVECELLDDGDPETRARAIARDEELGRRCNGIILVGGELSPGMKAELAAVESTGGEVINLLSLGLEPPAP